MSAKTDANWVVKNAGLTYQQMLNLTEQHVRDAFPNKIMSGTRINHTLAYLKHHLREVRNSEILQNIKFRLSDDEGLFMSGSLPDHEWEKGRENGKPFIKFWPEGKPIEPPEPEPVEEQEVVE